ncbi:MAG TPA: 50S ribosomal protein L9 [Candidatus Obscuribacterales bacterium]
MKVILQKPVQALGKAGDVVEAAPGYFRNFLQPRGLAVVASPGALKKREEDLEALRKKAEEQHQAAVALAERIQGIATVRIEAKAGEGGRLYGKVTTQQIAEVLSKAAEHDIDKRAVKTAEDINALGSYKATVRLAPEVQAEFMVEVVEHNAVTA